MELNQHGYDERIIVLSAAVLASGWAQASDIGSIQNLRIGMSMMRSSTCWYGQVVFVNDATRITRANIVLGAANKDGGAHVDAKLSKEYGALLELSEVDICEIVPIQLPFGPPKRCALRVLAADDIRTAEQSPIAEARAMKSPAEAGLNVGGGESFSAAVSSAHRSVQISLSPAA